jgi:hypothetical protein
VAHLVIALVCHVTLLRGSIGIISLSQAFFFYFPRTHASPKKVSAASGTSGNMMSVNTGRIDPL